MTKGLFVSNLFPDAVEDYRGLDNATVLGLLADRFTFRALVPRPCLPWQKQPWQSRDAEAWCRPEYLPVPYLPKIGSLANHHLMHRTLRKAMMRLHADYKFEFVLASWLYPDGWAVSQVAAEMNLPVVTIAQGTDVHVYLTMRGRRAKVVEAVEGSVATITRSESLRRLLVDAGCDASCIRTIWNGTDTDSFHPRDRLEVRRQLGVDPKASVVLFVGNLLPVKDPTLLLDAVSGMSAELVMIGAGPLEGALKRQAQDLGMATRVRFLGSQPSDAIARWMNAANLLCLTSHNEGLPNVVIEAMASGLPVVATDVGGIHELVDRPERGRLVSRTLADIREAIADFLQATPSTSAFGDFSWTRCTNEYAELLQETLEDRKYT